MYKRYSLTFLGVGAGLSPELGNNNVLLENEDRSASLLIDCGPVTAHDLKLAGVLPKVENVYITHVHDDHMGGLELWAQMNRYVYHNRPHLFFREELWEELWPASLRGGLERVSGPDGEAQLVGLDAYFDIHQLGAKDAVQIEGLPPLLPRRSLHVPGKPSFGFFLGDDVFYSSDTQELPPSVGPTGLPLRAIFQDCQLFDIPRPVHTSLSKLDREMAPELKAITRLMHYNYPPDMDAKAMGFWGFVTRNEPNWL
jgi:glyoxylase-like metal-dependent hydrolase (beta-lactamase superfamily II)